MEASGETRRRFQAMAGGIGAVLSVYLIGSVLARTLPDKDPLPDVIVSPQRTERVRQLQELTKQLKALGNAGRWSDVIARVDDACKESCSPPLRGIGIEAKLLAGKRADAADDLLRQHGTENIAANAGLEADVLAIAGLAALYDSFRRRILAPLDVKTIDALSANNLAWACLLTPGAPPDADKVVALAEKAALSGSGRQATFLNTFGAALYRTGRDREAIARLNEAEKLYPEPFNWPFLALAHRRLGNRAESEKWAARLRAHVKKTFGRPEPNRHELLLLYREMEQTLKSAKTE